MRSVYTEKCASKGLEVFACETMQASPFRVELEGEWDNMLVHQLAALAQFEYLWAELVPLFDWLEGRATPSRLAGILVWEDIDTAWSPPTTVGVWKQRIPLEMARFATANHLCVELGGQDGLWLVEPYALKRGLTGHLILYAVESNSEKVRAYAVDEIQNVMVTSLPFRPRFAVEITGAVVSP